jgi:hypothetical protein
MLREEKKIKQVVYHIIQGTKQVPKINTQQLTMDKTND